MHVRLTDSHTDYVIWLLAVMCIIIYTQLIHFNYLTCIQLYQVIFRLQFNQLYLIYKVYYKSIVCIKHDVFVNHVQHKKTFLRN